MRAWDFLIEDYKTTAVKFVASGIDKAQVDVYINKFRELSNKQKLAGDEKNIDTWAKKAFSEFKEFVDVKEKEVADAANKKAEKKAEKTDPGESIDITLPRQRENGWKILIPLDKKASCFYGNEGSVAGWCIVKRKYDHFNIYFHELNSNLIFCLNDKQEKWAIEIKSNGSTIIFYDIKNKEISKSEFEKQTLLKFADIFRSYKPHIEEIKADKQDKKLQKLKSLFPDATLETWHVHPNGGGWVQNTASVSASAFVGPDAIVSGNARVSDHAQIYGLARVGGNARVQGYAQVSEHVQISGLARVLGNARVRGYAVVLGNAVVYGYANVFGNAQVSGYARVLGNARVRGYAVVSGEAQVSDHAEVWGNAWVLGHARVGGNAQVSGDEIVEK